VVGTPEEADAAVENGKARKLAELREAGETREVYFEPMMGSGGDHHGRAARGPRCSRSGRQPGGLIGLATLPKRLTKPRNSLTGRSAHGTRDRLAGIVVT
jgi:hypothetical protein